MFNSRTIKEIENKSKLFGRFKREIDKTIVNAITDVSYTKSKLEKELDRIISKYDLKSDLIGKQELEKERNSRLKLFKKAYPSKTNINIAESTELKKLTEETERQIASVKDSGLRTYTNYRNQLEIYSYEFELQALKNPENVLNKALGKTLDDFKSIDSIREIAKELGLEQIKEDLRKTDGLVYFRDSANRHTHPRFWYERNVRAAFTREYDEYLLREMEEFEHDLVRLSAHGDCSPLCINYQGRIFSRFGKTKGYPLYENILWSNGGGFRHPNCRHSVYPFFPDFSNPDLYKNILNKPRSEIKENYNQRQQGMYERRQAIKWNDRLNMARETGNRKEAARIRNIRDNWKHRANQNDIYVAY